MSTKRKSIPLKTKLATTPVREVVGVSPTTYGVFLKRGGRPEAMFGRRMDAEVWAAMRDVLDRPNDKTARARMAEVANTLVDVQSARAP